MNPISPKKLINSKWTKVNPVNKERHFIVTKIEFDENSTINHCFIEAVITKQEKEINWIELKNEKIWLQGWK